jgi:predicted dehydrogenase
MPHAQTNLLLIGLGAHAKRIYYPICRQEALDYFFRLAGVVDLEPRRPEIDAYLDANGDTSTARIYLPPQGAGGSELSDEVTRRLDVVVQGLGIEGIILATDPLSHLAYARWGLRRGLSILVDKPITANDRLSTSPDAAEELVKDYEDLMRLYSTLRTDRPRALFSVVVQRRYHPGFLKAKELLREVFRRTNCPVTSIQSFHSDGQWRLPAELIDLDYHPFNRGYGKCCHSGYHFFDIVPWLLEAAEAPEKGLDSADVFANFLSPSDFVRQLNFADNEKLFPGCSPCRNRTTADFDQTAGAFGEIDAFTSFAFKCAERTMTLGSINLVHNGFSQRGWASSAGRDLYKGNGRLRHEHHLIEQGPFQAVSLISYQSREVDPQFRGDVYSVGGEYHFDVHVFRNSSLFRDCKAYEKFSIRELATPVLAGRSRGHQEDAKRAAFLEFVSHLRGRVTASASDLATHRRSVQLLHGVCRSAANRRRGMNPVVKVDFRPHLRLSTDDVSR